VLSFFGPYDDAIRVRVTPEDRGTSERVRALEKSFYNRFF